jgi:hypothetical protein
VELWGTAALGAAALHAWIDSALLHALRYEIQLSTSRSPVSIGHVHTLATR